MDDNPLSADSHDASENRALLTPAELTLLYWQSEQQWGIPHSRLDTAKHFHCYMGEYILKEPVV